MSGCCLRRDNCLPRRSAFDRNGHIKWKAPWWSPFSYCSVSIPNYMVHLTNCQWHWHLFVIADMDRTEYPRPWSGWRNGCTKSGRPRMSESPDFSRPRRNHSSHRISDHRDHLPCSMSAYLPGSVSCSGPWPAWAWPSWSGFAWWPAWCLSSASIPMVSRRWRPN